MPKPRLDEHKDLPPRWRRKSGAYYFRVPKDQQSILGRNEIRLGKTVEEAEVEHKNVLRHIEVGAPYQKGLERRPKINRALLEYAGFNAVECGMSKDFLGYMYSGARNGADARNIEFSLTVRDLIAIAKRAGGKCELTGIAWDYRTADGYGRRPWIPSLDRINSMRGYSPENCRIVCSAVNMALNSFGDEVLKKIARGLLRDEFLGQVTATGWHEK